MPSSQWCAFTIGTFGIVRCYIHIRRGASALLVSMDRAILRSLKSEASDSIRLHVFFLFYGYKESIASFERHMDKSALVDKIKLLEGLTNDEKADLIGLLRSHKKYGLVWEEKVEDVEEHLREQLPVLNEVKERAIVSDDADAPNFDKAAAQRGRRGY